MSADWSCAECAADEKAAPGRYCARGRCICGHETCHAYDTYKPIRHLTVVRPMKHPLSPRTDFPDHDPAWDQHMEDR